MTGGRPRPAVVTMPLLAALLVAAPALAGEPPAATSSLDPSLAKSLVVIESALAKLRGLPFKSAVATSALTHEGARDYIAKILHTEYPPDRLDGEEASLRYFGLLPTGQSLEKIYLDLMESQVAGLYDPPTKTLYVVQGPFAGSIALAHELAHALMDQHFDLESLEKRARDDDDRSLALSSLIEGEATMVMTLWTVQQSLDPDFPPLVDAGSEKLIQASGESMKGVPSFLRAGVLFPYISGMAWAGEVMRRGGGLKALDDFFRDPPDSSEQILHPEKSLPPRDVPSTIDRALVATGIPTGAPTIKEDSMGEFAIRFLLGGADDAKATEAAAGWDGDTYLLAGPPGGELLNWVSVWDGDDDAAQFDAAVRSWLSSRPANAVGRKDRVVVVTEGPGAKDRLAAIIARLPQGIGLR